MNVTYLRSSSIGAYNLCPLQFFFEYCLGIKAPSNFKADRGNIIHKALEILSMSKLAQQNNQISFTESESKHKFLAYPTPKEALDVSWEYYTKGPASHHIWTENDKEECFGWLNDFLNFNDGQFSPQNREVYWPEKFFDLEIKREDAVYYVDGVKNYLRIRGTVDLVTVIDKDNEIYEMVDFKTGEKKDWGTGERKTFKSLRKDHQLLMYYYALRRIMPHAKHIIVTIYYLRDGGPTTMCYDDNDYILAENMIVNKFNEIKNCLKPKRIYPAKPCWTFCYFGKTSLQGEKLSSKQYTNSKCAHMHNELQQLGLEKVQEKYTNKEAVASYTGGGKIGNKN